MTASVPRRPLGPPWQILLFSATLAGFVFVCYRAILPNTFLSDDLFQSQIWNYPGWVKITFFPGGGFYRPSMYSFWVVTRLFWTHAFPYRVLILCLHLLNAALLFSLTRRLTRSRSHALIAALLFVAFPPSAAAVNWLAAAATQVLSLTGYLLALRAFLALRALPRRRVARRRFYYALASLSLLLGLGANEMALTWPALALLLAAVDPLRPAWPALARPSHWPRLRPWLRHTLLHAWPLLAVWLGFVALRTVLVQGLGGYSGGLHLRVGAFLVLDLITYLRYFLAPWLALWQSFDPSNQLYAWLAGHRWVAVLGLGAGLLLARPAAWSVAATLLLLLPVWNIPMLHRGYFVGIGVAWMVVTALAAWQRRLERLPTPWLARATALLIAALLLAVQLPSLAARNAVYLAAGQWSRDVMAATQALVPAPAAGTTFYYLHLPTQRENVLVYGLGLREAVQKHYRSLQLDAYQVTTAPDAQRLAYGLELPLAAALAPANYDQVYLVYTENEQGQPHLTQVSPAVFAHTAHAGTP